MADNWFADQLIGSVGLGARAVSCKTPIYFTYGQPSDQENVLFNVQLVHMLKYVEYVE